MEYAKNKEKKMKYAKYKPLENMMCNIIEEGKKEVWDEIEKIKQPLKRCEERNLFNQAIKKIYKKEE